MSTLNSLELPTPGDADPGPAASGARGRPVTRPAPPNLAELSPTIHRYPPGTRFGVMSDSHGQRERTAHIAQRLVRDEGCGAIIHLGDFEDIRVMDALAGLGRPVHLVLGNCDWDVAGMSEYASTIGLQVDHPVGLIEVAPAGSNSPNVGDHFDNSSDSADVGRACEGAPRPIRIVYTHGHLTPRMEQAVRLEVPWLLHGHTHILADGWMGATRIVNPGALQRAKTYTVCVLDVGRESMGDQAHADARIRARTPQADGSVRFIEVKR